MKIYYTFSDGIASAKTFSQFWKQKNNNKTEFITFVLVWVCIYILFSTTFLFYLDTTFCSAICNQVDIHIIYKLYSMQKVCLLIAQFTTVAAAAAAMTVSKMDNVLLTYLCCKHIVNTGWCYINCADFRWRSCDLT